jgi:hypothetical protein
MTAQEQPRDHGRHGGQRGSGATVVSRMASRTSWRWVASVSRHNSGAIAVYMVPPREHHALLETSCIDKLMPW